MLEIAGLLEDNADELARLEVADTGKPWTMSRTDEIPSSIDYHDVSPFANSTVKASPRTARWSDPCQTPERFID